MAMSIEVTKQSEATRRLHSILSQVYIYICYKLLYCKIFQVVTFLPPDQQQTAMNALDRAKDVRLGSIFIFSHKFREI